MSIRAVGYIAGARRHRRRGGLWKNCARYCYLMVYDDWIRRKAPDSGGPEIVIFEIFITMSTTTTKPI
jgi:hypothetical protein